jgi:PAS domain S-box-containing protein
MSSPDPRHPESLKAFSGCIPTAAAEMTDLQKTEEALHQTEDRYRTLFNSIDEGFCVIEVLFDADGKASDYRFLEANAAFEEQTGIRSAVGRSMRETAPTHEAHWFETYGKIARTGIPARFEYPAEALGRYYDVYAFRIDKPEQRHVAILFKDIIGRKRREANLALLADMAGDFSRLRSAEEILRAIAHRLSAHLKISGCVFAEIDETHNLVTVTHSWSAPGTQAAFSADCPLSEYVGEAFRESARAGDTIVVPDTRTDPRGRDHAARGIESFVSVPFHREGRWEYLLTVTDSAPREWRQDEIELIHEVASRVFPRLERARAEGALSEIARQFRELADSMPQLVWVAEPNGDAVYFNRRWYEQIGEGPRDSSGERWTELLHPQDRARCLNAWNASLATGDPYQMECRIRVAGGQYRWFLCRALAVRDDNGRIRQWYGTSTDIEENKNAEERLRQTQKLESIGLLAGGIAHDFNNLLTGIMGNASLLLEDASDTAAERIRDVLGCAERAAGLTRQLLAYAGKGQFIVQDLDIAEVVQEISRLVESSIPKSVELVLNVQKRLPTVRMDPSQLQQVVMNLLINAGEAVGEGNSGRITLAAGTEDVTNPFIDEIGQEVAAGRYLCIQVTDTGAGIDEETRPNIFDPFFTTKFTGRGLALAAVAGILRSRGGGIQVETAPRQGSTFRVLLQPSKKDTAPAAPAPQEDRRGTVLVIDDESTVLDVIGTALRRAGYRVLTAIDGRESLEIYDRENGAIDAVVLDVVMPVMGAHDLLPELEARNPELKVLLTSGYSEGEARRLCTAFPGASFIQKPYTGQQIARAVEQLMGAPRP